MISVIIPAYNVNQYIDKCISSVVNQTEKNLEIIIINDGSNDGTDLKCQQWADMDKRIILINQSNQGQGSARNVGVMNACGDYILFLDADDYLDTNAVEKLSENLKITNADIIIFDYTIVDFDQTNIKIKQTWDSDVTEDKLINSSTFLWDKLFKKNIFIENKICLNNEYGEDLEVVYYILAQNYKVVKLDEYLYSHILNDSR